jgi:hypothetical protein
MSQVLRNPDFFRGAIELFVSVLRGDLAVVYRGRFFAMDGEGGVLIDGQITHAKVFGQMESYEPESDTWQSHAPMPTPRHAVGATLLGENIYVAGGGAVTGGSVQSAVHEAFTLAS